jgi:hypothetical protein
MIAARILKIVTAGFIAAGLLAAVPAESQALTQAPARSSAGSSSAGAADAATASRSAAVTRARSATSLPALTAGEAKALRAMLPACGCPPNAGEVEYALKELGVKSLSVKLLTKRLGKTVGTDAFAALAASLSKKAAKVRKRVPYPDYRAKSATTYAKSPYRVYEIYGTSLGPGFYHWTWKYGITRQMIPAQRPQGQLKNCTKYFGSRFLLNGKCTYRWLWIGVGWLQARTMEATFTLLYAITNQGKCPPGMPACV